ncbi:MAG: NAD(P)-dependent oxidoreductase [Myxococcota bacterium]|nr:NAD(P)-dependent oxidoreductase [Myxococcota bacterium]
MSRIISGALKKALVVEEPHGSLDTILSQQGFEIERISTTPTEDELSEILRQGHHQVLFKRSRVPVTRQVVEAAEGLVAIQLCCIGDDSVDKEACAEAGILVFNDPVSNGRSVVELVAGHLIALSRGLYETYDAGRSGQWNKSAAGRWEIRGKVLGIYGMGRIGRQVARTAEALGMEILFFDNREVAQEVGQEMGWTLAEDPNALFRGSDALTVHISANDSSGQSNTGAIGSDLLHVLGADRPENSPRIFVNLARGTILDPADLLSAVQKGVIRRAAVDVFPVEPRNQTDSWNNPYAAEPRIATTPHIGAATQEAQPRIAKRVAQTVGAYSHYGSIRDCVFSPRTNISMKDEIEGKNLLLVVHATARGTKKALDDAIYEAGASNLRSHHRDFPQWGIAVDVNLLDRPLTEEQMRRIVALTAEVTGDKSAVRLIRQLDHSA